MPKAVASYAKVAGKLQFWMTYHWLRFRAKSPTATLTLGDWVKPGEPGGSVGQQTMVNFVEVQPVLEDAIDHCEPNVLLQGQTCVSVFLLPVNNVY
jgi:hypothetical protein